MKWRGMDRGRVEWLMVEILIPIEKNYKEGPESRDRCYEALNALAASAALVIEGADGAGGEAEEFFRKALTQHLEMDKPRASL
jgi:hypothetical protein